MPQRHRFPGPSAGPGRGHGPYPEDCRRYLREPSGPRGRVRVEPFSGLETTRTLACRPSRSVIIRTARSVVTLLGRVRGYTHQTEEVVRRQPLVYGAFRALHGSGRVGDFSVWAIDLRGTRRRLATFRRRPSKSWQILGGPAPAGTRRASGPGGPAPAPDASVLSKRAARTHFSVRPRRRYGWANMGLKERCESGQSDSLLMS